MQYNAPPGSQDPNAPYVNGIPGVQKGSPVNANAVEYPQREIVSAIEAAGLTPTNNDLTQLAQAIALPVKPVISYGILPWSNSIDYPVNALTMGADGMIYQALQASGPNNGGAQPTSNIAFWISRLPISVKPPLYYDENGVLNLNVQAINKGNLEVKISARYIQPTYLQSVIKLDTINENMFPASAYNTSTYTFTAPFDGMYAFSLAYSHSQNGAANSPYTAFLKNNSEYSGSIWSVNNSGGTIAGTRSSSNAVILLNSGDIVQAIISSSGTGITSWVDTAQLNIAQV